MVKATLNKSSCIAAGSLRDAGQGANRRSDSCLGKIRNAVQRPQRPAPEGLRDMQPAPSLRRLAFGPSARPARRA